MVKGYAPITAFRCDSLQMSVSADLTGVYKGQAAAVTSELSIQHGAYVTITDEILVGDHPTTLRWAMVTPATLKKDRHGKTMLVQHGKKLEFKVVEPSGVEVQTWSTQPPHGYDAPNDGTIIVGFEYTIPKFTKRTCKVELIPQTDP